MQGNTVIVKPHTHGYLSAQRDDPTIDSIRTIGDVIDAAVEMYRGASQQRKLKAARQAEARRAAEAVKARTGRKPSRRRKTSNVPPAGGRGGKSRGQGQTPDRGPTPGREKPRKGKTRKGDDTATPGINPNAVGASG